MKRSLLDLALRFTKLIALAASLMLLAATLDNIPDCPELLNCGTQKAACLTTHNNLVPASILLDRMVWQEIPDGASGLYTSDPMRVAPPCFVRIAQHAGDPSLPAALIQN